MGDPRKNKKKYSGPMHPWQAERLEVERVLLREYGLKNKTELWKQNSKIKSFIDKFKDTSVKNPQQARLEKDELLARMVRLGVIAKNAKEEDILGLSVKNVLERRLQTLVFKKNLARSMKQARQLIVHRHIQVNGKVITSPSYIVRVDEQDAIGFVTRSPMFDETHPERSQKATVQVTTSGQQAADAQASEAQEAIEIADEGDEQ